MRDNESSRDECDTVTVETGGAPCLEMLCARTVRYSIAHTERPVFDPRNSTLRDVVAGRPVLFVVDSNVDSIYGSNLRAYAEAYLNAVGYLVLPDGELHKTWKEAEAVCEHAMTAGLNRRGIIAAVGGGVVLDVSGFAASIYRRGIGYLRIPTTLIGQVDVSVGIKQGINAGQHKNLLGSFYPPLASINDPSLLQSLPLQQIAAGFAEIVKMAMVADAILFEQLEQSGDKLLASRFQHPADAARAIMLRAEASMLRELKDNLFENNLKRLVDFGHTFSVALESDSQFQIPHGIAVGIDILISTSIAVQRSLCAMALLKRLITLYRKLGLPVSQSVCTARRLYQSLTAIRAHRGGALNLVVPLDVGQSEFLQDVTVDELENALFFLREAEMSGGGTRL